MTTRRPALLLICACMVATSVLCSCSSPTPISADSRARFHDSSSANVILRYYTAERVYLIKPEYREDGYLIDLTPTTLAPAFDRLQVQRNLAVVVLGWSYTDAQLESMAADWKIVLQNLGFKRVVSVRATGRKNDAEEALIISDTRLPEAMAEQATR
jgi:hypothetical protein